MDKILFGCSNAYFCDSLDELVQSLSYAGCSDDHKGAGSARLRRLYWAYL